ncbi:MAG: hypothetical protein IJ060_10740 [Oscillospiraceae bacterium]|nr:hypothetical protein [Oscillospiraceae bacterium]
MSILEQLSQPESWERFYTYKSGLTCQGFFLKALRRFIDRKGWAPVCDAVAKGSPFPLPRRAVISKTGSQKKRTVYIYPHDENMVLKLLTYLLLRHYDGLFAPNLFSFRPGYSAKDAIRRLTRTPGITGMYGYKVDISNYFNSVPLMQFMPELEAALADDRALFCFLRGLLEEPEVLDGDRPLREEKGIMAGTPLSSFYANLYLRELDLRFHQRGIPYARYSDDIILFAASRAEAEACAAEVRAYLGARGLAVNPAKECFFAPEDGWTFLGFSCRGDRIDIAPISVRKLKQKMRRKARALLRWRKRKQISGEKAAAAFIRIFNRKLLEQSEDSDLTWSRWFFSVINTTDSLHEIDVYAQDCIRFLMTGTRTKARYSARYADMKRLGYRSLVHAYYAKRDGEHEEKTEPGN